MSQLIEFKGTFIRICPTNPSHLLQLKDRRKSWSLLYDGSETMNSIMQIAADNTIILLFCNKGFFISKSGIVWIKIRDRQQLEDLKTDYEI